MYRRLVVVFVILIIWNLIFSAVIKGKVNDAKSGEELVGATMFLKELKQGTMSGLDSSNFLKDFPTGTYNHPRTRMNKVIGLFHLIFPIKIWSSKLLTFLLILIGIL